MKVSDEMWHCPKCGAGFDDGYGLTGPDYTTYEEFVAKYGNDGSVSPDNYGECLCERCGWSGDVTEIVEAHQKKQGRVPCPHCDGTGWVDGQKEGKR